MQNNGSMKRIVLLFGLLLLTFALYSVVTSRESFWGNNYSSEQNSGVESNNTNAPDNNDNKSPSVDSEKNSGTEESNKTNTSNSSNKKPSSAENKDNNSMDILVPDHDHIYELKVLVPSSCGVEGKQAYVCVACGKQQYVTSIAALRHNYKYSSELSVAPTCTTTGKKVEHCYTCGQNKEEIWAATGHKWNTQSSCDSNTNELVVTPYCTNCSKVSTYTYRYKINDVKKLVSGSFDVFGESDYTIVSDKGSLTVLEAPYYGVYCSSTYLLIVRSMRSIRGYEPDGAVINDSPLNYYKNRGCTVILETTISITADGRIQIA